MADLNAPLRLVTLCLALAFVTAPLPPWRDGYRLLNDVSIRALDDIAARFLVCDQYRDACASSW